MSEIRARVSLKVGQNSDIDAEIISFTGFDKDNEHVAMVFKQADLNQDVPLVRVHSECLTGDVFHSSRCDCGEQLDESINVMAEQGGIILYMRQEGRGIGLYNKIDAYVLQSQGLNTYQANNHLGFEDDQRSFEHAFSMLDALNIQRIKLLTNNPRKAKALATHVEVTEVVNTQVHLKDDNANYLAAKQEHGKHNIKLEP
ncbi:GTP cyclohydrolase II [Thalassotalea euphylliae]|uniref:GTP cyclohydrolase II n=1 Tax=Thalassotalea euphylliae TaxID=1655234 RepID=A0A3E0UGL5_9GAMM|nr:GTP cyclohydrolase II [Thalassotalea euphylliae]REL35764.1 GTP cyclohydrolase II [Thalassotalea euphylliae]